MIISKFQAKPGTELPALTNPAGAEQIANGYQAIAGDGSVVNGTYAPPYEMFYGTSAAIKTVGWPNLFSEPGDGVSIKVFGSFLNSGSYAAGAFYTGGKQKAFVAKMYSDGSGINISQYVPTSAPLATESQDTVLINFSKFDDIEGHACFIKEY